MMSSAIPINRFRPVFVIAASVSLFISHASTGVHAETAVEGSMGAAKIDARDSSVAEVLDALGRAFGLKYRTAIELNRPISGTFEGPVLKTLSRLLENYDYITKSYGPDQSIEVIIIKLAGKDSAKVVSIEQNYYPPPMNSGQSARVGGPYPHPLWSARNYSRNVHGNPVPGR